VEFTETKVIACFAYAHAFSANDHCVKFILPAVNQVYSIQ